MKRYAIAAVLAISLTGCGWFERKMAVITGYSTFCVSETNVQYVQGASGLAVLVDQNGKPVACK